MGGVEARTLETSGANYGYSSHSSRAFCKLVKEPHSKLPQVLAAWVAVAH